jgi:acyl carrier protein
MGHDASMSLIEDEVVTVIAATLRVDRSLVTREASLVGDLQADSLDWVSLVLALEDRFAIDIPDDDAAEFLTVKQVTEYVAFAMEARLPSSLRLAPERPHV